MRTEDDLRAAFLSRSMRQAPEAERVLAGVRSERPARRGRAQGETPPKARGWMRWAAPVAAAAVVTVLAISLAVARHAPGDAAAPAPAAPAINATLPEYYAALDDPAGPITQTQPRQHQTRVSIRVGNDRTGKIVATVSPPAGETFAGLTAAADDRTFVAAAERFPVKPVVSSANPVAWYLLRLTPRSAHPVTLTRLPIPGRPAGTQVSAIALSPNGAELAVMYQVIAPKLGPLTVALYSLATGKPLRTWTTKTKVAAGFGWYWGRYSNSALTWLDGGRTLAVIYGANTSISGPPVSFGFSNVNIRTSNVTIRTVDAGSPSGNLLASSKVVYRVPNPKGYCDTLQLTADGKTVLCGEDGGNTAKRSTANAPKVIAYSVATGKSRLLYQLKGAYEIGVADVLWASPTGSTVLGALDAETIWPLPGSKPGKVDRTAGLITKGTFKSLRFPLPAVPFAGEIAF